MIVAYRIFNRTSSRCIGPSMTIFSDEAQEFLGSCARRACTGVPYMVMKYWLRRCGSG